MWRLITSCTRLLFKQNKCAQLSQFSTTNNLELSNNFNKNDENKKRFQIKRDAKYLRTSTVDIKLICETVSDKIKANSINNNAEIIISKIDDFINDNEMNCTVLEDKIESDSEIAGMNKDTANANNNDTPVAANEQNLDELFFKMNKFNEDLVFNGKLEHIYALNKLAKKQYSDAIPYLKTACEKGCVKAYYNYALLLQNGLGIDKDAKLAFEYFKKAANHGHAESSYNCAIYYLKCKNDIEMCIKYMKLAIKLNLKNAKQILAILFIDNKRNLNEAFNLLISLDKLDSESEYYLGLCYENGWGVEENFQNALKFYENSTKHGNNDAKLKLIGVKLKLALNESKKNNKKLGHFTQSLCLFDNNNTSNHYTGKIQTVNNAYKKASDPSSHLGYVLFNHREINYKAAKNQKYFIHAY